MLFGKRVLLHAVAFWQVFKTGYSQNVTANTAVPACANTCMVDSMFITDCDDTTCLCHQKDYQKSLFQCLYSQCDPSKYGPALGHTIATCLSTGAEIYMVAPAAAEEAGGDDGKALLAAREQNYLAGLSDLPEVPGLNLRQDSIGPVELISTATLTIITNAAPVTVTTVINLDPSPRRIGIALHNDDERDAPATNPVAPATEEASPATASATEEAAPATAGPAMEDAAPATAPAAEEAATTTPTTTAPVTTAFATSLVAPSSFTTVHDHVPAWLMEKDAVASDEAPAPLAGSPTSGAAASSYAGLVFWVALVLLQDLWVNWSI